MALKSKVSLETWEKIQQTMTNLCLALEENTQVRTERVALEYLRYKAIFARSDQRREYPNQTLAAHVVGYASSEPREVNDTPVNDIVGQDGIEQVFNSKLAGVRGWRVTEADHQRRELVRRREEDVEPRDGLNVVLTIDSVIQHIVEAALADGMEKHSPISISGIVVRPAHRRDPRHGHAADL